MLGEFLSGIVKMKNLPLTVLVVIVVCMQMLGFNLERFLEGGDYVLLVLLIINLMAQFIFYVFYSKGDKRVTDRLQDMTELKDCSRVISTRLDVLLDVIEELNGTLAVSSSLIQHLHAMTAGIPNKHQLAEMLKNRTKALASDIMSVIVRYMLSCASTTASDLSIHELKLSLDMEQIKKDYLQDIRIASKNLLKKETIECITIMVDNLMVELLKETKVSEKLEEKILKIHVMVNRFAVGVNDISQTSINEMVTSKLIMDGE